MAQKRTKSPAKVPEPMPTAAETQPRWVASMQEFFQLHGYYRAEDVKRVLGDPRETVELGNNDALPGIARLER